MVRKNNAEEVRSIEKENNAEELEINETFCSHRENLEAILAAQGAKPSYENMLDLALEYTFPCSDPTAIQSCCARIESRTRSLSETE